MTLRRSTLVVLLLAACTDTAAGRGAPPFQPSGDDGDEGGATLDVEPLETSGEFPEEGEGGDEGVVCAPEDVQACACPDDIGAGLQLCEGGVWGPCACDGAGSMGDDGGDADGETGAVEDSGDTGDSPPPTEVCFPGADGMYTTCLMLHAFDPDAPPTGYEYPAAIGGDPNYRRPVAFVDLDAEDPGLALAPNFTLGEFAQAYKGRWGIVQPHAVEAIQALRDDLGPLVVNSGYRSPEYNAGVGGAGSSRHMYGDGFDLDPVDVSLATLESACTAGGGMLVEYETHVHCDWRFDAVDEAFFGPADAAMPRAPALAGTLHSDGALLWTTQEGFDEGEPVRRWTAWDREGREIATAKGRTFVAPATATRVQVSIGAAVACELRGTW